MRPVFFDEIPREAVPQALGRRKTEIGRLLGILRQTLYDILNGGQSVTVKMKMRTGKMCGNVWDILLKMQARYDRKTRNAKCGTHSTRYPS